MFTVTQLLFTPCPVTRYAMHRIYAKRINSRGMSRDFGIPMPKHLAGQWRVNSNKKLNKIKENSKKYLT